MANQEKPNWLVELLTFVFSWFMTSNEKVNNGIRMFVTIIMVVCLVLGMITVLFTVIDMALPVISESLSDGLLSIFGPTFDALSVDDSAINQLPPPAGGAVTPTDVPST